MSKPLQSSLVLALLLMATNVVADNSELWDLYPSGFEFSQYDENVLTGVTKVKWFTFNAGANTLIAPSTSLTADDGPKTVTMDRPDAALFKTTAGVDWQWSEIFSGAFVDEDCEFSFVVEQGTVLLPASEGYRFGQRETLSWSGGAPDVCREKIDSYFLRAKSSPFMSLHVNAWFSVGGPEKPAAAGKLEFLLTHDLRRSKRLLPLELTAEVDAGVFTGELLSPGSAEERFALIQAHMVHEIFEDSFDTD